MGCECASVRLELLSQHSEIRSQRELMVQWFETLLIELKDVKKQNSELHAKINSFTNSEEPEANTNSQLFTLRRSFANVFVDSNHDTNRQMFDSKPPPQNLGLFVESIEVAPAPKSAEPVIEPGLELISDDPTTPELQTKPQPVLEVSSNQINLRDVSGAYGDRADSHSFPVTDHKVRKTRRSKRSIPMPRAESTDVKRSSHKSMDKSSNKRKRSNFRCSECPYETSYSFLLKKHSLTHTGGKTFSCDVCDYKCKTKADLIKHIHIHTKKKLLQCSVCNKAFTDNRALVRHKLTHTGEKPFECNICKISFNRKDNFIRHNLTHTEEKPFSCDVCDYKGKSKRDLVKHNLTHTGEKLFECDQCNYRASHKHNLIGHHRTHTGEKPFACDLCDYRAALKTTLVNHNKRKHIK